MSQLSPAPVTTMAQARSHRSWALAILIGVYVFNFIDRQVLSIMQEEIKADLGLSDLQLGLLGGFAFAVVYCTVGIPVARIADRGNRKAVVAGSLAVWSGFTALCGLAGNFWHLLIGRLGVGLGEAGGSPPAHAMISDYYEKERRGRALAIYSAGLYIGTLLGYWLGGALSDALSWREAFFLVGLPGVAFAVVVWMTVREPARGLSGAPSAAATDTTFVQSFRKLWKLSAFRYYALASGAGLFVTYGVGNWVPSFLLRTYDAWALPDLQRAMGLCQSVMIDGVNDCVAMSATEIGLIYGTVAGIGGAIGTLLGGYLADRLGARDRRWFLWVPMWGKLLAGPPFLASMFAPNAEMSLLFYFPAIGLAAMYLAPAVAITHHLVAPGMRAMSSAVLFFIFNMIGLGLGPTFLGAAADWFTFNTSLGPLALQWAMVTSVLVMYPLTILWHLGAMKLPRGPLDDAGQPMAAA